MLKTASKSQEMEDSLVRMIVKDGLKEGDAILSENRLATLFGVSRVTVRQAIGNLEQKGILRSEHGRGTFVTNLPKIRNDQSHDTKLIGFVCCGGIDNPYMAMIAHGVELGAEPNGFHLCICSVVKGVEREAEVIRKLLQRGIDGLIISPVESNPVSHFLSELARNKVKMIIVDSHIPGLDVPAVSCDDREGGFIATQRLISAGHRRIAHIRGPELVENAVARFDGYRMALERHGIAFDARLAPASEPHFGYTEEAGQTAMQQILELSERDRPTAVFAANDNLAIGAWDILKAHRLSVPEDISLVGYGNLRSPYERGLLLTSVDQRPQDIGFLAWDLLKRLLANDNAANDSRTLLRPKLIDRSSIANVKGIK